MSVGLRPARRADPSWGSRAGRLWIFSTEAGPTPRFVASGLCAVLGVAAAVLEAVNPPAFLLCVVLSYVFGGLRAAMVALGSLRAARPDINFLMILAAVVSAGLGYWHEGAILLFLFSLSEALERYAIERTRYSVRSLMNLRPERACVVRDEREFTVGLEELRVGDVVRVRPGERFPVDGLVVKGNSAVDESIVTGEPMPVDKQPGDGIFAGTINANGSLLVRMTRPATESTLARIVQLVERAQERKATAQRLIDKWQGPYVLGVLGVSALTILVELIGTADAVGSLRTGMILLVAASPCAVVLASPVAVLAAVTRGARAGVLFKGGTHLEQLAILDTMAFDKTGTITYGRPTLTGVEPIDGVEADAVLAAAASVERHSEHPLAGAIVAAAQGRSLALREVEEFSNEPGAGVWGRVDGQWVGVGRAALFDRRGVVVPQGLLERAARSGDQTGILVLRQDGLAGLLTLSDQIRPEAPRALEALRELGIAHFVLLTGDQEGAARNVGQRLGIREVRAGLRPEEKLTLVHLLTKENAGVAMVGDGVNDAPALAASSVGIAMGAAGSDVALETADVVLMRDDLCTLADAVHLARRCRTTIQRSLALAFGVIAGLVVLTLAGLLTLPLAVVCHEGSTVLVVLNGLRLLREPVGVPHHTSPHVRQICESV